MESLLESVSIPTVRAEKHFGEHEIQGFGEEVCADIFAVPDE